MGGRVLFSWQRNKAEMDMEIAKKWTRVATGEPCKREGLGNWEWGREFGGRSELPHVMRCFF